MKIKSDGSFLNIKKHKIYEAKCDTLNGKKKKIYPRKEKHWYYNKYMVPTPLPKWNVQLLQNKMKAVIIDINQNKYWFFVKCFFLDHSVDFFGDHLLFINT